MKYIIDRKRLKVRDIRAMQTGNVEAAINIMAACMVDAVDRPIERGAALELLDDLTLDELSTEVDTFAKALAEAEKESVPLSRGDS